jgi:NADPH:quinone reductase-like Zn-dependent oxidoreductase
VRRTTNGGSVDQQPGVPVTGKFVVAQVSALGWLGLSALLSLPWVRELATTITVVPAILVVGFVAYLPGWLVAFLAVSLLLDRQPPLRRSHPTIPVTVLVAARNEADRIQETISYIAGQDYPGPGPAPLPIATNRLGLATPPGPGGPAMKAFVYEKYGPPETLRLAEVDKPAPDADHVLVKVRAASVNAADWHVLRGKPLFSRATLGLLRPKRQVLGVDIAGQVEAVGSGVTRFQPGDEVYANLLDHGYGGFAEYVSAPVDVMSLKPPSLSFEEAAAVPMAAATALQGLRRHGELQPGQRVLINGASGGVGTFAVQLAKAYGAEVTAVTSTRNLELVGSLGADHVLDYTTTDALGGGQRYDLILDTVGNRSVPDLKGGLAQGGKAAVTGFTSVAKLLAVSLRGGKDIAQVQAHVTTRDLELLSELIEAGKVRPQIDRRYRFTEIPAAIAYLEQGRARAKVVAEVG